MINEIIVTFLLVVGGPYGDNVMSIGAANKSARIALAKLNSLTESDISKKKPLKFKGGKVIKIRQRYLNRMKASDVYIRGSLFMNYVHRNTKIKGNYIHIWDTNLDWENLEPNAIDSEGNPFISLAHGWAFLCQDRRKKGISYGIAPAFSEGIRMTVFNAIVAAHEIGHMLGFEHVAVFDYYISIMDADLAIYRYTVVDPKMFKFYDQLDALSEFQCKINSPDRRLKNSRFMTLAGQVPQSN